MPAPVLAAVVAAPLAEKALERSGKIVATVLDALRMPMLDWRQETARTFRGREIVEKRGISVPAWAVVAGGVIALALLSRTAGGGGGIGGDFRDINCAGCAVQPEPLRSICRAIYGCP